MKIKYVTIEDILGYRKFVSLLILNQKFLVQLAEIILNQSL